jgi:phage-related minor tail protein
MSELADKLARDVLEIAQGIELLNGQIDKAAHNLKLLKRQRDDEQKHLTDMILERTPKLPGM